MSAAVTPQCPRCRAAMRSGFLATAQPLSWVDRVGVLDAAIGNERIVHMGDVLLGAAHLPGWRCSTCRVMLVDYGALRPT